MEGRRDALIVAIGIYEDEGLRRLRAPAQDAEALASTLGNPDIGAFRVQQVVNQPHHEIAADIQAFFKSRSLEDLLLLHVSCHGVKDENGRLFFAGTNTKLDLLEATAISSEFVKRVMDSCRARSIVVLVDCCYSGAMLTGAKGDRGVHLKERLEGTGRVILTASNSIEYAWEGDDLTGEGLPSVFTSTIVQGLQSGEADRHDIGWISIDDLYDYVYERLLRGKRTQTPQRWSNNAGEIYIARNRRHGSARENELPEALRAALDNAIARVRLAAIEELAELLAGSSVTLRAAALRALQQLLDDNSRSVAEAAAEALQATAEPMPSPSLAGYATIGIDLGTTNSHASLMVDGKPVVVPNSEGSRNTPSVVAFNKAGDCLVGQPARRQAVLNPENTVSLIKRFIGRRFSDIASERQAITYTIDADNGDGVVIDIPALRRQFSPVEISAAVLRKLKVDTEAYLGKNVTAAVIAVPAYFNFSQRQATRLAGELAGLTVLRIISEPTAASIAYGLGKTRNETILVFDLGGGTFDVSILDVGDGVFEVKATNGDTHLGGVDYDRRVVDWLADEFKEANGIGLKADRQALQRLTEAAEQAKIELSSRLETTINLPFITADQTGPKHLETTLTRAKFEALTADLTERCRGPFMAALKDAGLTPRQLDEIVLVGGSTRMPAIQQLVKDLSGGKEPHKRVNLDEVVAVGAGIQAAVLSGDLEDVLLLDVTPLSLGIETLGGVFSKLIDRNTTIPTSRSQVYSTAADNQTSVEVHVLQGEHVFARDNRSLGRLRLDGIAPAPRGAPRIEVTLDIDANDIFYVTARDKGTGREQSIVIDASSPEQQEPDPRGRDDERAEPLDYSGPALVAVAHDVAPSPPPRAERDAR